MMKVIINLAIQMKEEDKDILDFIFSHYLKIKELRTTSGWASDAYIQSADWDSIVPYKVEMIRKIKSEDPNILSNERAEDVYLNLISDPNNILYWKSLIQSSLNV